MSPAANVVDLLASVINFPQIAHTVLILTGIALATALAWYGLSWATSPLRRYPGPVLAGWTNLWRLAVVRNGRYHLRMRQLHDKYGPVVRVGPNTLSLNYPDLIKTVYGTDGKWPKTEFYHSSSAVVNGKIQYTLFGESNPDTHARMKRPVVKYFATGAVLTLEPHIDRAIVEFCKQLDSRFVAAPDGLKTFDLLEWVMYLAWDFSSAAIFSRRFGYIDQGCDFDGSISMSQKVGSYFQQVAQLPALDFFLEKNPVLRIGPPTFTNLARVSVEGFVARLQGKDTDFDPKTPDFLQHFIDAKAEFPDVDDGTIIGYVMVSVIAGGDTTALVATAVLYFALRHPAVYEKLVREVRGAQVNPDAPVPYNIARRLSYLEASIRETTRLHPVVGMQLERYVPEGGLALPDGSLVPPGTGVGLNPYIIGRNAHLWGEDVDDFRPERWLRADGEDEAAFAARWRRQAASDLNFGAGERMCLGKNLGLVEVYKIVATLLNRYDMELADPGKEWVVDGGWMLRPRGLSVTFVPRKV